MSDLSIKFDKKAIFQELQSAIDRDKQYWLQNDAKIKAVHTATSYEDFQQRVAAAHLQPIKKEDKRKIQRTWNTLASTSQEI